MQYVRLFGVLDDGTDRRPRVPLNTAKTITLALQTSVTIEVSVVNNAGVDVDLRGAASFTAWFSVVRTPECPPVYQQQVTQATTGVLRDGTRNVLVFTIPPVTLRNLPPGRYFYDVMLDMGGNRYQLVRISALVLEATLRRA